MAGRSAATSPHLLRYNERVRIDGHDADDADLVAGFQKRLKIGARRHAADLFRIRHAVRVGLFARNKLDLAVLEVGLGGGWTQ